MIRPRPAPPYLPIYPESERARIQRSYEMDALEWQREASRVMWSNSIMVIVGAVGLIAAALMGPQIVIDALIILARR